MNSESLSSSSSLAGRAGKRSREAWASPSLSDSATYEHAAQAAIIRPPAYGKCVVARDSARKDHCEDAWCQQTCVLGSLREPLSVFAVFDGHGGDGASKHSVQRLIHHLQQHLSQQLQQLEAPQAAAAPVDSFIEEALHAAFQQTDSELADTLAANCGTTATVAVVSRRKIFLAWAGDSRAVVLADGKVVAHTEEHRAEREDEQERLAASGGRVFFNSGLRVMGILATTRAIGDHDLRPYGVVPTPDVLVLARDPQQEFLVLGSDGLWDVMKNQEVYEYANKTLHRVQAKHKSGMGHNGLCCTCQAAGIAARALAQCARKQRHSQDDITVLLVNLKTPCTCVQPLGPHYTHNSSLLGKAPTQLIRTGGLLGSCSADQALQQQQQQGQGGSPSLRHCKEQRLHTCDVGSSSNVQQPQQQPEQLLPSWQPSEQQQLQPSQPVPVPAYSAALLVQPSVCPGAMGSYAARRQQLAAAVHVADMQAAAPPVSDLVMSSPFAGMLASAPSRLRLDTATDEGALHSGEGLAAVSCSAPASTAVTPSSSDIPGWSSSSGEMASGTRQVGSAPPDVLEPLAAGGGQQVGTLSLGLALSGNGRTCGLLGSALKSLGSSELPVVVTT